MDMNAAAKNMLQMKGNQAASLQKPSAQGMTNKDPRSWQGILSRGAPTYQGLPSAPGAGRPPESIQTPPPLLQGLKGGMQQQLGQRQGPTQQSPQGLVGMFQGAGGFGSGQLGGQNPFQMAAQQMLRRG